METAMPKVRRNFGGDSRKVNMEGGTKPCPFGSHRVLEPKGVLPQPAWKIDNRPDHVFGNEILVNVEVLNIDSASFTQIKEQAGGDENKIRSIILDTVEKRGKMHNPVTGSGGMFIGTVEKIGEDLAGKIPLSPGTRIASLVSLSLTPLYLERIIEVRKEVDQVLVEGKALLFESGIYAVLPEDIPAATALAVLDVCGAPAQTARLVKDGDRVVIIGASGKSGILCCYAARRAAGAGGKVIGLVHSESGKKRLFELGLCDEIAVADASDALACYGAVSRITGGALADLVINCVNVPDTEMASILSCRDRGRVYFFSMATSFTKAALGAEGVGKDIDMIIGNGYARGHAETALNILRESPSLRELYTRLYGE